MYLVEPPFLCKYITRLRKNFKINYHTLENGTKILCCPFKEKAA